MTTPRPYERTHPQLTLHLDPRRLARMHTGVYLDEQLDKARRDRMNIFESIYRTTTRTEPFHSQFLADALKESICRDRSLFDPVWRLIAPKDWDVPEEAKVRPEDVLPERRRIDVLIECKSSKRIVGIEVKTTDSSATPGQLGQYYNGLEEKYHGYDVAVAYLTPFNREQAGDKAVSLPTVTEFENFEREHPTRTCHVSWLDIAAIPWDGNELWRQHQQYVCQRISSLEKLCRSATRDRSLDEFFGEEPVDAFWRSLEELRIPTKSDGKYIEIKLSGRAPDFATKLAAAFRILIEEGEGVHRESSKKNDEGQRDGFLEPPYGEIHGALFALAERYNHVWLAGSNDYGLRVAHRNHRSSGVSLVRSDGAETLKIVLQR